jgi:adenine-specific DNA-methyltransferase
MKYLGNKTRLLEFIYRILEIEKRSGQSAIDLCSGTGSVSSFFRKNNIKTIGVDMLYTSYLRTKSLLEINLDDISNINLNDISNKKSKGFIYNNYSDICGVNIFKKNIAESIDGNRSYVEFLFKSNEISEKLYHYLISLIIEESDFRSNIMGSYASFYKKGWRNQALKDWGLKNLEIASGPIGKAYNLDIIDFLSSFNESVDFIYFDPPYNGRQYIDNFHVLETIALYDDPKVSGKINTRIEKKKSTLCNKRNIEKELNKIFSMSSNISNNFFMSYSSEGIIKIKDIEKILLKYFSSCEIFYNEYRRFKTNSNTNLNTNLNEVILFAKK